MQVCIQPRPLILGIPPPWSPTRNYPVLSNIDEMSILAILQRKGKIQNQETSGFESQSHSR
jgi:hypothetical protein